MDGKQRAWRGIAMKANWEKIEKNVGVLDVEVDEQRVAEALDHAFRKIVKQVNVPGFRKGKVPRKIFEARFGVESLYKDALDYLLPIAYAEAVEQTKIEPVDRPDVDVETFEKGQPFRFKAKVTVKPEVKLGEYKGIEVPAQNTDVTEEEINEELKRLQNRHAELVVLDEGPAQMEDFAIIDFEGFIDGEPFEGGKGENYTLPLGSGTFIPGFEEQIVGMNIAEEKEINVTFPENYRVKELAGKPAVFKVKLKELKRKNLPELDDEFAKDISEFETLEEYKQDLAAKLKERKEKEAEAAKEAAVVEKAAEAAEVDIPEVMINHEVEHMLWDFESRLRMQGMTLEMYYQFSEQNEEKLREQMRPDAAKRVRNNLVLEAIAKAENIEATEEEIAQEVENFAKMYNRPVDEIRTMFQQNGYLDSIAYDLKIRKTIKFLAEHSKTAEENKSA